MVYNRRLTIEKRLLKSASSNHQSEMTLRWDMPEMKVEAAE